MQARLPLLATACKQHAQLINRVTFPDVYVARLAMSESNVEVLKAHFKLRVDALCQFTQLGVGNHQVPGEEFRSSIHNTK